MGKPGDSNNRMLLRERSLQVYYRGKGRAFALEYVQQLALEHRKLWLPLIGGGILASLCLLALLKTYNIPYRLLAGAAIGLLSCWWGYRGSMALVVYEQRHHTDFLIPAPAQSLQVFVAFANRLIRQYPQPLGEYCVALSMQEWEQLQKTGFVVLQEPRLCVPQQEAVVVSPGEGAYWALFDPFLLGERLQWSLEGSQLVARLQGEVASAELRPLVG